MPGFKYEALDKSGAVKSGVLNADSARQVRQNLRNQGLMPVSVTELAESASGRGGRKKFIGGVSAAQLSLMTRQFASLMAANITVEKSLNALIEQVESRRLRQALAGVRGDVLEGKSLAESMRNFPSVFPEFYHSVVASGEASGKLDVVLLKLADYTERSDELRRKVTLAFIYPIILTVVASGITIGLLVYVVPQVVNVFKKTHQQLPALTVAMIALSDFLREYYPWLIGALIGVIMIIRMILKSEDNRRRLHVILMKTPMIGWFLRSSSAARLSSTLAILVGSGVPLISSLEAGAGVITVLPMRDALTDIIKDVREGGGLARAMERRRGMFPPLMVHFIASGEDSGKLGEMLDRAADQQAKELGHRISTMTSILEPAMILIMGAMVLTIVLSVLLPIFEMNQIVH